MFAKLRTATLEAAILVMVAQLTLADLQSATGATQPVQNVVSEKRAGDLKLIRVPLVRQATEFTCGPAAVESVAFYFGKEYNESQLAAALNTNSKVGTFWGDIVSWGQKTGFKVAQYHGMTLADLQKQLESGLPVICLIQAWPEKPVDLASDWNDGHYVVAVGYDDKNVYFMDPWTQGHYTFIENQEFLNRWHDRQREAQIVHLGIVLSRPQPQYDSQVIKKTL